MFGLKEKIIRVIQMPAWKEGKKIYNQLLEYKRKAEEEDCKFMSCYIPSKKLDYLEVYLEKSKMKKITGTMEAFFLEGLGLSLYPSRFFSLSKNSIFFVDERHCIRERLLL